MTIEVCCNGDSDGAGTHVSVFAQLLDVPYKEQLKWPFKGTVTYELLNQLQDMKDEIYCLVMINMQESEVVLGVN